MEEDEAAVRTRRDRRLHREEVRVLRAAPLVHEEEVGGEARGHHQTLHLPRVVALADLQLVVLEDLPGAAGLRDRAHLSAQHASHQVVLVPVHERVLAKLPTADLAVLLEYVLNDAGLVLLRPQRLDERVHLLAYAGQVHVAQRLRQPHRALEGEEDVCMQSLRGWTTLVP